MCRVLVQGDEVNLGPTLVVQPDSATNACTKMVSQTLKGKAGEEPCKDGDEEVHASN